MRDNTFDELDEARRALNFHGRQLREAQEEDPTSPDLTEVTRHMQLAADILERLTQP